ncbi:hypothetical protein LJR231_001799 [Phyllobacterium sp. LjRoot231]|uniref:hypothetical protein n=1 Tax=Phyllobacterium sp. LjRoot231 TaxID=3342289 RepID=UPI003ED04DD0
MDENGFLYDVAFSFHSLDEGIATQLNDLLSDRFKTFIYSEQQKKLAGTDGEKNFNAVYGGEARVVIVFYRPEWGETPFTRIEQTAIRNRAFSKGYDFTLFIPTVPTPQMPPWLPKTQLYYGLDRFGLDGAAAVVETRIQQQGGNPQVESITDRAARFRREADFQEKKALFGRTEIGVRDARLAADRLIELIKSNCATIAESDPKTLMVMNETQGFYYLRGLGGLFMTLYWRNQYSNDLDGSELRIEMWDGVPDLPGLMGYEKGRRFSSEKYNFTLLGPNRSGYVDRSNEKREFSVEQLADKLLRSYMDAAVERSKKARR